MVAFKKFFLAASLLLGGVAAAPALQDAELDVLEKRVIEAGSNANSICERQFVNAMQIKNNCGSATIVDLTGCTALFFYLDTTLRRAVHIFCGDERTDAEAAAKAAAGSTSVTIAAASQENYDNAVLGVKAGNQGLAINPQVMYTTVAAPNAVTFTANSGSTTITEGEAARVCTESE